MSQRLSIASPCGAFRYCLDPVFLTAAALYMLNRWVFKPLGQGHVHFFAYYGNSLFCIAFCLPPVLFVYRLVGLREPKSFPTRFEIVSHLIVWSLFFKWLAPTVTVTVGQTVRGGMDIVARLGSPIATTTHTSDTAEEFERAVPRQTPA